MRRRAAIATGVLLTALLAAFLAAKGAAGQSAVTLQKSVALVAAPIYLSPDPASAHVGAVRPGEAVGVQSSAGNFVQVFTGVSGWMRNQGLVRLNNPQAPELIFGAAVGLEDQAESSAGQQQAALDAARLYLAIYDNFPQANRAAEALYRGAEIRWEISLDEMPKRRTPSERQFPNHDELRRVIGKYPATPWAAWAAYQLLIEHFTCGDWVSKPECVGKEADTYHDYVKKYPNGPATARAAYDAVYREAIAWTLYSATGPHHDSGKAAEYQRAVASDAAAMSRLYTGTDWAAQAGFVAYTVGEGMPMTVPATPPLGGP